MGLLMGDPFPKFLQNLQFSKVTLKTILERTEKRDRLFGSEQIGGGFMVKLA
jgi:hypothetical protein